MIHTVTTTESKETITLSVKGILDITSCSPFWDAAHLAESHQGSQLVVDLADTKSIRDSGLAVLMMLRNRVATAQSAPTDIDLVNCSPALKNTLAERGFGRHFNIS